MYFYTSILSCIFISVALIGIWRLFVSNRIAASFRLVLLLTLFLKVYCSADLYLHGWDERYHALVAKNMLDDPLKPTLYKNPLHHYDITDWTNNHIWLSKPPVGLFIISNSIRIFGQHEYAVRVPGIIASLLSVYIVYLIFSKVYNQKLGLISSFFFGIHGVLTDLASGRVSSDAIETLFLLSINFGVYLILFNDEGKKSYRTHIKVGLITGISFLIKWQPALLILLLYMVDQLGQRNYKQAIQRIVVATISALVLPGVWILYASIKYPEEMAWMLKAMFNPLYGIVANNDSKWYSQISNFGVFFGYSSYLIILYYALRKTVVFSERRVFMLTWIIVPLTIFSFAEIKRGTYLIISAPAMIGLTSAFLYENWFWLKLNISKFVSIVSFVSIGMYSAGKLYLFSKDKPRTRDWSTEIKARSYLPGSVIYDEPHYIEVMFYHDVVAYPKPKEWYEENDQSKKLQQRKQLVPF
jgi:4-amino-4-deoxy-L-arabinose transferase-like glycosyltransferase